MRAHENYVVFVSVVGTLEPCLKLQFDEGGLGCRSEGAWKGSLFKVVCGQCKVVSALMLMWEHYADTKTDAAVFFTRPTSLQVYESWF